jgi:transposase
VASTGARGRAALCQPHGGGRARGIDAAGEAVLRALAAERHDRTLDEYREQLAERSGGVRVSRPPLCRALERLGRRRKKDAARRRARRDYPEFRARRGG